MALLTTVNCIICVALSQFCHPSGTAINTTLAPGQGGVEVAFSQTPKKD